VALEGELRIGLRVSDARIERIGVTSSRPDVARSLLQGRSRAEAVAAVPRLFSICGHSQAAASELACATAAGEEPTTDTLARCSADVASETLRESAWRTLLEAPQWVGENPGDDAIAAARSSLAFRFEPAHGHRDAAAARAIAVAAFGIDADEWLALGTLPGAGCATKTPLRPARGPTPPRRTRHCSQASITWRGSPSCQRPATPTPISPACRPGTACRPRPVRWRGSNPTR
jgi:hypothetical protein